MPKKSELKHVTEELQDLSLTSVTHEAKPTEPKCKICSSLNPEQFEKRQKAFLDKYGFLLKQFTKLTTLTESKEFLTHYWEFVCDEAVIAVKKIAEKLAEEQKDAKMVLTLVQCLTLRFIMNIMEKESIEDMRRCIMMFFERMHVTGSPYYCAFIVELSALKNTTRENALKKMAKPGSVKSEETKPAKPAKLEEVNTLEGKVKTNGVELKTELAVAKDEETMPKVAAELQSSKK